MSRFTSPSWLAAGKRLALGLALASVTLGEVAEAAPNLTFDTSEGAPFIDERDVNARWVGFAATLEVAASDCVSAASDVPLYLVAYATYEGDAHQVVVGQATFSATDLGCAGNPWPAWASVAATWQGPDYEAFAEAVVHYDATWGLAVVMDPIAALGEVGVVDEGGSPEAEIGDNTLVIAEGIPDRPPLPGLANLFLTSPEAYGQPSWDGTVVDAGPFFYPSVSFELGQQTCLGIPSQVVAEVRAVATWSGQEHEVVIGRRTVTPSFCELDSIGFTSPTIRPDWTLPGVAEFALAVHETQQPWHLRLVIDPDDLVPEGGGFYDGAENRYELDQTVFPYNEIPLPFTGRVRFGAATATLSGGTLHQADPPDYVHACVTGGTLTYAADGGWGPASVANPGTLCGDLVAAANGLDLAITTGKSGPLALAGGMLAGLDAELTARLGPDGVSVTDATLTFPRGQGMHGGGPDGPSPRGRRVVTVHVSSPTPAARPEDASFYLGSGMAWFTSEGSPVSVGGLYPQVWQGGIYVQSPRARWRFEQPYHRWDLRNNAAQGPKSNDVRFRFPTLAGAGAVVGAGGLRAEVILGQGSGRTHYPRGDLAWGETIVRIAGGALEPTVNQASAPTTFTLRQTGRCPACGVGGEGPLREYPLTLATPEEITADGRLVARVAGVDAQWGPERTSSLDRVFARRGDAGTDAILHIPGWEIGAGLGGVVDVAVPDLLAGPVVLDGAVDGRSLSDPESQRGNGFFPGLTIGPETYRDASGQPVAGRGALLSATQFDIAFGGPDKPYQRVDSSPGTKLVITPAGVTGAFNFDAGPGLSSVYGFPFALTRFAFRTLKNQNDDVTWLDGEVRVGGKADFRVPFRSLALECSGHFGGGGVDFASLTPQRLRAWNAGFEVNRLGFVAAAGTSQCGGADRRLEAGGGVRVESFGKSIDLAATWKPDGSTEGDAKLGGDATAELDRPASGTHPDGTERRGFMVGLASARLESRSCIDSAAPTVDACGWFAFGAKVGTPFWNAIDASLRLTNVAASGSGGGFAAGRALVVPKTYAHADWTTKRLDELLPLVKADPAAGLSATNDWVFEVTLPTRWAFDAPSSQYPRFVADPLKVAETDLKVLKVKGAVPYITEHATEVSFGASADLSKLEAANVALEVDLTNKESVKKVDAFFAKIIPALADVKPVETAVGVLQDPATKLLKATGAGFDNFIGGAVKEAIESDLVVSATDGVASALSAVQRLPLTLADQIFGALKTGIDEAVTGLLGSVLEGPNKLALDLYNQLPALWLGAVNAYDNARNAAQGIAPAAWSELRSMFLDARAAVWPVLAMLGDNAQAGLVGAIGKTQQGIDLAITAVGSARDAVTTLGGQATTLLTTAKTALTVAIDLVDLDGNPQTPLAVLKCPKAGEAGKNPLISKLDEIEGLVKSVTGTLANKGLEKLGGLLGKPIGVDLTFLKTADFYFANVAAAITRIVLGEPNGKKGVIPKVREFICDPKPDAPVARLRELTSKVKAFLVPIRAQLETLLAPAPGDTISRLERTVMNIKLALTDLEGPVDPNQDVAGKVTLRGLKRQLAKAQTQIESLRVKLEAFKTIDLPLDPPANPADVLPALPPDVGPSGVHAIRGIFNEIGKLALSAVGLDASDLGTFAGWVDDAANPTTSFVSKLPDAVRKPVNAFIGVIESEVGSQLTGALSQLPFPTGKQIRQMLLQMVLESDFIQELDKLFHEGMAFVLDQLNSVSLQFLQQVNELIKQAVAKFNETANQLLNGAVSEIKDALGFSAAGLTGSAVIQADEIERLHLEATFSMNKTKPTTGAGSTGTTAPSGDQKSETGTEFKAYLDAQSWKVNGKAKNCGGLDADGGAPLDVRIGAQNLPIKFGANDGMGIKKLELGFTLSSQSGDITPIGVFGGIETSGKLSFKAFELSDLGLAAGVGKYETYIGAKGRANFQGTVFQVAFLAGEMCNLDVLKSLDPLAASFLKAPDGGAFKGAYVRGAASFPFVNLGCLLQIGATANVGAWVFAGDSGWTVGGLVSGGIYGKAICLVSAKGMLTLAGQYANDAFTFLGTGWVAGGLGFCEPEEWNTPDDVANDGWCATATASLKATYDNGFHVEDPQFDALQ